MSVAGKEIIELGCVPEKSGKTPSIGSLKVQIIPTKFNSMQFLKDTRPFSRELEKSNWQIWTENVAVFEKESFLCRSEIMTYSVLPVMATCTICTWEELRVSLEKKYIFEYKTKSRVMDVSGFLFLTVSMW